MLHEKKKKRRERMQYEKTPYQKLILKIYYTCFENIISKILF